MNAKGTGLGLSICKQIIEQMGGSVDVKSTLGKGTQFIISLNPKVIDKIIIKTDQDRMSNDEKNEFLKSIKAFQYTNEFN